MKAIRKMQKIILRINIWMYKQEIKRYSGMTRAFIDQEMIKKFGKTSYDLLKPDKNKFIDLNYGIHNPLISNDLTGDISKLSDLKYIKI